MAKQRPVVSLPSVTSKIPPDERQFLERVREALNSGLFVTKDDLALLQEKLEGTIIDTVNNPPTGGGGDPGDPGDPSTPPEDDDDPLFPIDPTPDRLCGETVYPTAPTGLEAHGAFSNIILEWDNAPYCGHAYTEVWASEQDDLSTATLIGQVQWGSIFIHPVGGGSSRYYWIRFVNDEDAIGPYNAVAGTYGETAPDIEYILDLIEGEVTESQLWQGLGDRIDLIDGPDTLDGSVAQRILQTSTQLGDQIAAVEQATTVYGDQIDGLYAQYTVKIDIDGYVSGYGLSSEVPVDGTPFSQFLVRADRFAIGTPQNNNEGQEIPDRVPFFVQTTTTTIQGETVEPGVYMSSAFIFNGMITNAKIGNAAIDDAKIANVTAGKIRSGFIEVGTFIQSSSYSSGNYGWRIDGEGNIEAFNGTFTGRIEADEGYFKATIQGGDATTWDTGTGLYSGPKITSPEDTEGPYVFRVGNPEGDRFEWDSDRFTIYDQQNRPILQSGQVSIQALPWLGDLATKDKIWGTDIGYIPYNKVGDFGIDYDIARGDVFIGQHVKIYDTVQQKYVELGVGDFVNRLWRIDSSRIDNFFTTAAIGHAYIGSVDAATITVGQLVANQIAAGAITTLKLNGEAVVTPRSANNAPIGIYLDVACQVTAFAAVFFNAQGSAWTPTARIRMDGSEAGFINSSAAAGFGSSLTVVGSAWLGVGNHTISVDAPGLGYYRLIALATKR